MEKTTIKPAANETADAAKQQFAIHKIYAKESSFISKNVPDTFKREWKPDVNFNMENKTRKLEDNLHEVDLTISFTVKLDDPLKPGNKIEVCEGKVAQSGIFTLVGFAPEQMEHMLVSYCPNVLYPFIRESIADMVERGGYPQILISPINFDMVFAQLQEQRKEKAMKEAETAIKQ